MSAHAATPEWIWSEAVAQPEQIVFFRKAFDVKQADIARIYATCDDELVVSLNGKPVLIGQGWDKMQVKEVDDLLVKGRNVLVVKGTNHTGSKAGLIVRLDIESRNRKTEIVSDATWKVSDKEEPGLMDATTDDSNWQNAVVVAKLGEGAWAKITEKTFAAASKLKEPEATPIKDIKLKEGFKAELLYSVPMKKQGSWVASCFDDKGRLIESDQYGKLYRVTPPPLGGSPSETKVEEIPVDFGEAQGLLHAFGALYAITNSDKYPRGLWRISDTNGDDVLDKVEQLRAFENKGGEHGPHAVILGPDKKSLYIVSGNQTAVPKMDSTRVPPHWDEDNLLPPLIGRGFMREVMAPGAWIAKTDPEGKTWELVATGCRNTYDAAFNREGELFTYDADMEWDFSVPWYRPTRVCQVVSGAEFGWRSLSKKWPVRWEDSVPPVVDIGPGSPTGMCFGYGSKFPAKYQEAMFICDWSYGKMYAVHLKPNGAICGADVEEFMSAQPLPLTDVLISPMDGAMYVTIGGRRVQSGLYRVTYSGSEGTQPSAVQGRGLNALTKTRHQLEAFHGKQDPKAVEFAWPYLGHEDRAIRFAARTAIEHQPLPSWLDKALNEKNPRAALTALMALCRAGMSDKTLLPKVIDALDRIDFSKLQGLDRETYIRDYYLALCRFGEPDNALRQKLIAKLSPLFPTGESWLDVDLCEVLAFLGDAAFLPKAIAILEAAPTQEEQIAHAKSLRFARTGWTPELRERYFKWVCLRAPTYTGGANFQLYLKDIRRDAEAGLTDPEKVALKPILDAKPDVKAPQFTFTPRNFVRDWKMADLEGLLGAGLEGGRNFANARNLFGAATCFACHRFGNEGGAIGPDLTSVAGKYSPRDLLTHIIDPNKEISDQYGQLEVTLNDGSKVFGRIMNLKGDSVILNINMMDPNAQQTIDRKIIKSMGQSKVSMMPPGLLNTLKDNDILDLLAYLLSKGNKEDPMFK